MRNQKKYLLLCIGLCSALSGCAGSSRQAETAQQSESADAAAAPLEGISDEQSDETIESALAESGRQPADDGRFNPDKNDGPRSGQRGGGGMAVETDETVLSVMAEGAEKFQQFTFDDTETGVSLEYNLYIPKNMEEGASYPLLMFIPDATAPGKTAKEIVEQYYGADIWVMDEEQEKHPSFVLVPNFSEVVVDDGFTVSSQVEAAVNLIHDLSENYPIDTNRLYTTGQSMGCMTSLYLNSKYPDLFAASLFVSGQWDISVLQPLEEATFFYITAAGDEKASGGQDEMMAMFDSDGIGYSYGTWSPRILRMPRTLPPRSFYPRVMPPISSALSWERF